MTLTCRCGLTWHDSQPKPEGHEVVYRLNTTPPSAAGPYLLLHNPR